MGGWAVLLTHGAEHSQETHFFSFSFSGHLVAGGLRLTESRIGYFSYLKFLLKTSN